MTYATPFNGRAKTVERSFGTLAGRFCKLFESYCGRSPQHRPEDVERPAANLYTPEQIAHLFGLWVAERYHAAPHTGLNNETPDTVYARELTSVRRCDAAALRLLMTPISDVRTVGKNGITVNARHYLPDPYIAIGTDVRFRTTENPREIAVYDARGVKLLAHATLVEKEKDIRTV